MPTKAKLLTAEQERMIRALNGQDIYCFFSASEDAWAIVQKLPEMRPVCRDMLKLGICGPYSPYKFLKWMISPTGMRFDASPLHVKLFLDVYTRREDDPRNADDLCLDSPDIEGPEGVPNPKWQPKEADVFYDRFREETPEQKDRERDAINHLLPIELGGKERATVDLGARKDVPKKLILPKHLQPASADAPQEKVWNDEENW